MLTLVLALVAWAVAIHFIFGSKTAQRSTLSPQKDISVSSPAKLPAASRGPLVESQFESLLESSATRDDSTETEADNDPVETAANSVAPAQIPAILEWLGSRVDEPAAGLRESLVRRWAENDPAAAAEWTTRFAPLSASHPCVQQVATAWAGSDPAAAEQWARSLPGDTQSAALTCIAYEAAREDPVEALNVAAGLASGPERDRLLAFAASQWAASDPQSAATWAASSPDPAMRQKLVAAIAVSMAAQDGAQAAALLSAKCPAGEEQNRAAVAILQRWTRQDPREAAAWVAAFPETELKRRAEEVLGEIKALKR